MDGERTRRIEVGTLARVEGEGALTLRVRGDRLLDVQLRIYEPPRFFEALLRGRDFREAPDISARICGICPIAYQLGAAQAMEDACGVQVGAGLRALRRLIYCGEWIESHALHVFLLHLPDFLGMPDAVALAEAGHRDTVQAALRIRKLGNALMRVIGGREIHPVNLKVGGFWRAPDAEALQALLPDIGQATDAMLRQLDQLTRLAFPDFTVDCEFLALRHDEEYAITEGRLVSSRGVDLPLEGYDGLLTETHVRHSTALQSQRSDGGTPVHVGPLARLHLNRDRLPPELARLAGQIGLEPGCRNPFKSLLAHVIEVLYALGEARRLIDEYRVPEAPAIDCPPRAGTGYGATEAPRGLCYHRYTLAADGVITDAKIVAPTSVNQRQIEADLHEYAASRLDQSDERLRHGCERLIRSYDPCISCSTHFLTLNIENG